ncbi:hypothetical protein [Pseudescherichia sp.]|uniref:hypothetical protein n=1 Tax=Pseudescherichia sp. TaxID=2055881 RepID=UPI0028A746BF|nr:hypothetical protein [Pseudescherichia sp.]
MQYNTLTNMIAFTVAPDEMSPSKETYFLLAHDMFNIAQLLENAMRNNYTVMVEHEEGQTYVATVGSAA